jgi:hypothetical protein
MVFPDESDDDAPKKRSRTVWSKEEELWIVGWVEGYVKGPTFDKSTKRINWKKFEHDLKTNDDVAGIFQADHQNSTKVMECAKRLAKKLGVSVQDLTIDLIEKRKVS